MNLCGPFGSAFSRCFETAVSRDRNAYGAQVSRFDVAVLFAAGLGLPSALSALRQFIELRRTQPSLVPPYCWFVWQCRHEEELQLAWDALHLAIFDGLGERAADQADCRYGLDLLSHQKRRKEAWCQSSNIRAVYFP